MAWKKPEIFSLVLRFMNKFIIEESCSEIRILDFLSSVDREFTPFLSEKVELSAYAYKLAKSAHSVFLVVEGHDVGHAAYYSNDLQGRTAFLTSICVKPEFRGGRFAEVLLEKVLRGAMNDGMKALSLEVDARNQAAVRFYRKHGFNECGNNLMVRHIAEDALVETASGDNRSGERNSKNNKGRE